LHNALPAEKELILAGYLSKVINPYLFLALFFVVVAALIYFSNIPNLKDEEENKITEGTERKSILSFPYLVLGVVALFLDGSISVAVNNSILYGDALGIPFTVSRHFSTYALTFTFIGFFGNTLLIPKYLTQQKAIVLCAITGFTLTTLSFFTDGVVSVWFLLAQAFLSAFTWGSIWGLAIRNLGKYTKLGSALLLMTLISYAIAPVIFGKIIDLNPMNPRWAVVMLIPTYIYLFYYGKRGYKVENW
jgi:fucose permease